MSRESIVISGHCSPGSIYIYSLSPTNLKQLASVLRSAANQGEEIDISIGGCPLHIRYGLEVGSASIEEGILTFVTNRVDILDIANTLDDIADDFLTAPDTAFPHLHFDPGYLIPNNQVSDIVFEPVGITHDNDR